MSAAAGQSEERLYAFLRDLRFEDLPPATVESALALILDQFTCCLIGLEMPWTQTLRDVVAGTTAGGDRWGSAEIYGDPTPVAPGIAALVNGTAAHGFDLDDLHFATMSHPGCIVVPAAVAMGLAAGASGRDLVTAVVAGYEPMLRTGLAAGLRAGELGFHATGVLGPLGSATAASLLLDGPGRRTVADAIGLAASMGGGIKAFNEFGPGTVKRLHAGRAAESGVLAAELASGGYRGPERALTARYGLAPVMALGEPYDADALARDLGERYLVDDVYIKPYAACGAVHGAVQAAERIAAERPDLVSDEIREVVVGTSPRALAQNSDREPADVMAAQYSTEISVAIALLGGASDPRRFVEVGDDPTDPARALAQRIRLEVDDQAARAYPDPNEGRVDVTLGDGSSISRRGSSSPATSRGWEVAAAKFEAVAEARLDQGQRRAVLGAVRALADGGEIGSCTTALRR